MSDPFSKQGWHVAKVPAVFATPNAGRHKSREFEEPKSHLMVAFEVSLADVQNDEVAFRKFKRITEDIQGKNCLISMAWI